MTSTNAIVSHEPKELMKWEWSLEEVTLTAPGDDEILVEMYASGICHTDILLSSVPAGTLGVQYPKVVGHEGIFNTHSEPYPAAIQTLRYVSNTQNRGRNRSRSGQKCSICQRRRSCTPIIQLLLCMYSMSGIPPRILRYIRLSKLRRTRQIDVHGF